MKLFIFGLGCCGQAVARQQRGLGHLVAGTLRNPGSASDAVRFDDGAPLPAGALDGVTHLLSTIPPVPTVDGPKGDPVLAALAAYGPLPDLAWAGYLSTTGVYGDWDGQWVDEDSELRGRSPRSLARIATEQAWLDSGLPVHIFRLGGIYGPGRSPLEQVRNGTAHRIVKPGQVFGRIHVDDVAGVVAASIARPEPHAIYNVCDDEPAPPQDVVAYAAHLLGVEPPPEIAWDDAQADMSAMARSFYEDNKRVSNRRIKERLGYALRYPTYREGLRVLL
jgi:nucleoside-diphosphate-sugar epimerase